MAGGAGPTSNNNGGGGGSGAGPVGGGGFTAFHTLPVYPRTQFQIVEISGGDSSFFPSSYLPFAEGIAGGEALLSMKHKTLGEVAKDYRQADKPKAKVMLTQDQSGNAVIERQQ